MKHKQPHTPAKKSNNNKQTNWTNRTRTGHRNDKKHPKRNPKLHSPNRTTTIRIRMKQKKGTKTHKPIEQPEQRKTSKHKPLNRIKEKSKQKRITARTTTYKHRLKTGNSNDKKTQKKCQNKTVQNKHSQYHYE